MGNSPSSIGTSIGDTFYPSNPDRRNRAQQLQRDVEMYVSRFNEEKQKLDSLEPAVRQRIERYLSQHGYQTLQQLIDKNDATLKGDAMESWKQLKASLSTEHFIDQLILTVTGLTAAATGVVVGGLVLFGVMSGPVGWAIFAGVGEIMGFLAVAAVFMAVIEAAKERENLQQAINKLYYARIDALTTLRKLEVYQKWVVEFSDFFKDEWVDLSPDIFDKKFGKGFAGDAWQYDRNTIISELQDHDDEVHAWKDEDPEHPARTHVEHVDGPIDIPQMAAQAAPDINAPNTSSTSLGGAPSPGEGKLHLLVTDTLGTKKDMNVALEKVLSPHDFVIVDIEKKDTFGVTAAAVDTSKAVQALSDLKFGFTNLATHAVSMDCKVTLLPITV
ncbi:uncharacterized protein KY384_007308 [Bacidia gigantensis]|uniref:uncharacterized protein n=1 Tax=Bacidia gigantensis TaxID=2732470 RepID=UPI001D03CC1C|nr:uncharacterized protein KY384_007308 [Bacidia gigantensis]KAG8528390.1 hypothetical protein KY384_007308 [Bacidia gigantensis]